MQKEADIIRIEPSRMLTVFREILEANRVSTEKAEQLATVFTENSLDGVITHGVNRFHRFIDYVMKGYIVRDAEPVCKHAAQGIEQWDGNLGPGILNALKATSRCCELAQQYGIGCVALANTHHWLRGGTYGQVAAKSGFVFIGWTNTVTNLPPWGAVKSRLGNNPMVMAAPYGENPVVLDMSTSQYSYGAMEMMAMKNQELAVYGGYDKQGNLSRDPAAILASARPLPVGYWKGAGLSLLLDILAAVLSGGWSTAEISRKEVEYGLSQVFIAVDLQKLGNYNTVSILIRDIIDDYQSALMEREDQKPVYPGEKRKKIRQEYSTQGIPVLKQVWDEITALK